MNDYGAKGDGVTDDYQAIHKAIDDLKKRGGGTLNFPTGSYRIAAGAGRGIDSGGIELVDVKNVTIAFSPGAELLMDNLNAQLMGSQGHGVFIAGKSEGITLQDVRVRWKQKPTQRSQGDGIRILGSRTESLAPANIALIRVYVENTPQAGVVVMGAKNIAVTDLTVKNTGADGLHFNACYEGIKVNGLNAENTGDDGLAFVTYFDRVGNDPQNGPFSSPDLTTRNNTGAIASHIRVSGGLADGVRIAGGCRIQLSDVSVDHKKVAGVVIDSAVANGTTIKWSYLASRMIHIQGLQVRGCTLGFQVQSHNAPAGDADYYTFDVTGQDLSLNGSSKSNLFVSDAGGVALQNIAAGESTYPNYLQGVSNLSLKKGIFTGGGVLHVSGARTAYVGDLDQVIPNSNITLGEISIDGAGVIFQELRVLNVSALRVSNSPGDAIQFVDVLDSAATDINVSLPNRKGDTSGKVSALKLVRVRRFTLAGVSIQEDAMPISSIEIGGGTAGPSRISTDIKISGVRYSRQKDENTPDIVIQGGPFAPLKYSIDLQYRNQSDNSPEWKNYSASRK
ncbi:MAG: glycosyl hydrolase family 28-related protein [Chthoniobacter sp.]